MARSGRATLNPHGRGHSLAARGEAQALDEHRGEHRALVSTWDSKFAQQRQALAVDDGLLLLVAGRGGGKSESASRLQARWILETPTSASGAPAEHLVIGPDMDRVLAQFRKLERRFAELAVPGTAIVRKVYKSKNDLRIVLWTGQTIFGVSASDPDKSRAYEAESVWIDEAALCDEAAFALAVASMRTALRMRIVVTSTPRFSWIWRVVEGEGLYGEIREAMPVRILRWASRENPFATKGNLAAVRATSEAAHTGWGGQELDGRFSNTREDPSSGTFSTGKACVEHVDLTVKDIREPIIGLDLGRNVDWTWLCLLGPSGHVLANERLQLASVTGVGEGEFYDHVEDVVVDMIRAWRVREVRVDTARHGDGWCRSFTAKLKREGLSNVRIQGFHTDAPGRRYAALRELRRALAAGQIVLPERWTLKRATGQEISSQRVEHADEMRLELNALSSSTTRTGRETIEQRPGTHDDGPIALALAWGAYSAHLVDKAKPPVENLSRWMGLPPSFPLYQFR